jgi:hypothetical protein
MCKDLWIIDYDRACDDYADHVERFGADEARERLQANLKALGFDGPEIDDHVYAICT